MRIRAPSTVCFNLSEACRDGRLWITAMTMRSRRRTLTTFTHEGVMLPRKSAQIKVHREDETMEGNMNCRILIVVGVLLVSVFPQSVWTVNIAHAQEQMSPDLLDSDIRIQADVAFWQAIVDSEDPRDFRAYLEQFPGGLFAVIAPRMLLEKVVAKGEALLNKSVRLAHRGVMENPLVSAACDNDVDVLEWLAMQGADVNAQDIRRRSPIHCAAQHNAVAAMEWLWAHGADINAQGFFSQAPIHYAAKNNAVAAMEWLKAKGANINARGFLNRAPIHYAAEHNAIASMEWLKANGADIEAQSTSGATPMHLAADSDSIASMEWLKANGADIEAQDEAGATPVHTAAQSGSITAMGWLRVQGAAINAQDIGGNVPMHHAALFESRFYGNVTIKPVMVTLLLW